MKHMHPSKLPLAPLGYEQDARNLFPVKETSPEEYAARNGRVWLCFSFDKYSYRDKQLENWLQRLGEILKSQETLQQYREQYLSLEEKAQIEQEIARMKSGDF